MNKLKEKLQQMLTNKTQQLLNSTIDLNETLQRNSARARTQWNVDESKYVDLKPRVLNSKLLTNNFFRYLKETN